MGGNFPAPDNGNQVLKVRNLLIGKLVKKAGNVGFQRTAVFQGFVTENIESQEGTFPDACIATN